MSGTIADWERDRFAAETTAALDALDVAEPARTIVATQDNRPEGLVAWAGRVNSGFVVQGLVDSTGQCYISCGVNGRWETIPVSREDAADAFDHPYAYGASLPL